MLHSFLHPCLRTALLRVVSAEGEQHCVSQENTAWGRLGLSPISNVGMKWLRGGFQDDPQQALEEKGVWGCSLSSFPKLPLFPYSIGQGGVALSCARLGVRDSLFSEGAVMQWYSCPGGDGVIVHRGVPWRCGTVGCGQWARWGGLGGLRGLSSLNDSMFCGKRMILWILGKGLSLRLSFTSVFLTCGAHGVYVELKMVFVSTLRLSLREADALGHSLGLLEKLRAGWSLKAL